jgi:hypothetical protein
MGELPPGETNLVLHTLARVDGLGEFWDPPSMGDLVALVESTTPGGSMSINKLGHRNDAGQLDVRFYLEYKPRSFDAQQPWTTHSWKRTAKVKEARVDYDAPSRVLYHEER